MELVPYVMAPGAHGHKFCSDVMCHDWNRSPLVPNGRAEYVEEDLDESGEILSGVFQVKDQTL